MQQTGTAHVNLTGVAVAESLRDRAIVHSGVLLILALAPIATLLAVHPACLRRVLAVVTGLVVEGQVADDPAAADPAAEDARRT